MELVNQYLTVPQVSGELAQKVMNETLKYQGWKYVYGGETRTLPLIVADLCNGAMEAWYLLTENSTSSV